MNLVSRFKAYIQNEHLFSAKDVLLVAVSGGVDSVVLCELCRLSGYQFIIAHCNFQLRGKESERDEAFVRELGRTNNAPVVVKCFDTETYALAHKISIQVAARNLRYEWFDALLNRGHLSGDVEDANHEEKATVYPSYILTAHHADDNIETVLMNFFKGTGILGLKGIRPRHKKIVRPLLFARKNDLLAFAEMHGLSYVEDSSNTSDKYSRNYFRNQVIPLVKKNYPEAEANILDNINRFGEINLLYDQAIAVHKKKLLEENGREVRISVLKMLKVVPLKTILYEIIKEFRFSAHQVDDVSELLHASTGKYIQSSTHRILRNRAWLLITPVEKVNEEIIVINEGETAIHFAGGKLLVETKGYNAEKGINSAATNIACLDADQVSFPLLLRKWKAGDYFYPLGMKKKKKLSRFFIDQKMSLVEKEATWVLEMNKKIVWVVNRRIDDRYKITPGSTNMLKIEFLSTIV